MTPKIKPCSKLSMMNAKDPRKLAKLNTERIKAIQIPAQPGFKPLDLSKHSHLRGSGKTFAVSLEPGKPA